ncbi:MAG: TRAP transporter small permease [Desulfobacterales bacterium]|nr:TRAP transporter small permease [Desulfobacterales bacterium]
MSIRTDGKFRQLLLYIAWFIAGTFLIVMTSCVFLQVFTRYIFKFSFSWPEELARFSFIWTSLCGAFIALEQKKLHDIDFLFNRIPDSFKPVVSIFTHLLVCTILIVFVVYGVQLTTIVHSQTSPAMEIRMSYVYFAVPFATALMLISYVRETFLRIKELINFKRKNA